MHTWSNWESKTVCPVCGREYGVLREYEAEDSSPEADITWVDRIIDCDCEKGEEAD